MVFNPLRSIQHGSVVHKQRIVFRGITVSLSKLIFLFITPLLFISPILPSLPPCSSGRVTCRSGEEEDGVLQQQPVREEDQQCCRLYSLHGGPATLHTSFTCLYMTYVMCNACMLAHRLLSCQKQLVQKWNVVSSTLKVSVSIFMSCFQVEGSELKKVRTNSRVYQRYYLLDTGLQALCWEPSKKESDKARISLASIREVKTFSESALYECIIDSCGLTKAEETFTAWAIWTATGDLFLLYLMFLLRSHILGTDRSQHRNLPHQRRLWADFRGLCVLHHLRGGVWKLGPGGQLCWGG